MLQIKPVIKFLIASLILIGVLTYPFLFSWNFIMPKIFSFPKLNFAEAFFICLTVRFSLFNPPISTFVTSKPTNEKPISADAGILAQIRPIDYAFIQVIAKETAFDEKQILQTLLNAGIGYHIKLLDPNLPANLHQKFIDEGMSYVKNNKDYQQLVDKLKQYATVTNNQ